MLLIQPCSFNTAGWPMWAGNRMSSCPFRSYIGNKFILNILIKAGASYYRKDIDIFPMQNNKKTAKRILRFHRGRGRKCYPRYFEREFDHYSPAGEKSRIQIGRIYRQIRLLVRKLSALWFWRRYSFLLMLLLATRLDRLMLNERC